MKAGTLLSPCGHVCVSDPTACCLHLGEVHLESRPGRRPFFLRTFVAFVIPSESVQGSSHLVSRGHCVPQSLQVRRIAIQRWLTSVFTLRSTPWKCHFQPHLHYCKVFHSVQSSTLNTFQYSNQMDISIFNTYFYISRTCFVCYIRHLQGETLITCTNPSAFYCVLYMLHWLYYRLQHICFCRFTMFLQ